MPLVQLVTQVWTGSVDKTILAFDSATYTMLYSLGDQGGYIKSIMPAGWCIWTVNSAALRICTAETLLQTERDRVSPPAWRQLAAGGAACALGSSSYLTALSCAEAGSSQAEQNNESCADLS
jgi:hypothetical protein